MRLLVALKDRWHNRRPSGSTTVHHRLFNHTIFRFNPRVSETLACKNCKKRPPR
jgi:hypothetical protein